MASQDLLESWVYGQSRCERAKKRFYSYDVVRSLLPYNLRIIRYQRFEFGMNQLFICSC